MVLGTAEVPRSNKMDGQDRPLGGLEQEMDTFLSAWCNRIAQFGALLAAAAEDTISLQLGPDRDHVYIQARREDDGWLVEAVSNNFLSERTRLSVDDECTMVELGWQPPTRAMPNFFRCYDDPVDLLEVAKDILITFGVVYGALPHGPFFVSPPHLVDAVSHRAVSPDAEST
jgi:hypothetical protein